MENKHRYYAIFERHKDGISVKFPDFPSCFTCGDTEKEALNNAKEALALHIYGMEQDKDKIPNPTPVTKIESQKNQSIVLVEASRLYI